jgi:hypothetical protein
VTVVAADKPVIPVLQGMTPPARCSTTSATPKAPEPSYYPVGTQPLQHPIQVLGTCTRRRRALRRSPRPCRPGPGAAASDAGCSTLRTTPGRSCRPQRTPAPPVSAVEGGPDGSRAPCVSCAGDGVDRLVGHTSLGGDVGHRHDVVATGHEEAAGGLGGDVRLFVGPRTSSLLRTSDRLGRDEGDRSGQRQVSGGLPAAATEPRGAFLDAVDVSVVEVDRELPGHECRWHRLGVRGVGPEVCEQQACPRPGSR